MSGHYACSNTAKGEGLSATGEQRGARITIAGQGPCAGEITQWSADVASSRIDVHGTHGTASKCQCTGSADFVLRNLEPGTYDVQINGGFNRPIATRVTVH
jgi:hypothetical protein